MTMHRHSRQTAKSLLKAAALVAAYLSVIPFMAELLDAFILPYLSSHLPTNPNVAGLTATRIKHLKTLYTHLVHKNPRRSGEDELAKETTASSASEFGRRNVQSAHSFFKVSHTSGVADADMTRRTKSRPRNDR